MAKHLSKQQAEEIVGIMDGWPTGAKLTWNAVLKRILNRMRISTTRQTLARDEKIKVAFQTRKAGLRKEADKAPNDRVLAQRLRRVTAENARLREQNERYREQLARWQYNAFKRGLKKHHLDEPLPEVDRQRSA